MGFSNMLIHFCKSIPKSTLAQSRPSLTYSSWIRKDWSVTIEKQNEKGLFDLLEGEHVLVEELLQLLVDVVDADLLKGVEVWKVSEMTSK